MSLKSIKVISMEIKGRHTTAIVYTDNIETTAISQIEELCNQDELYPFLCKLETVTKLKRIVFSFSFMAWRHNAVAAKVPGGTREPRLGVPGSTLFLSRYFVLV